jgi:predicted transcriptional regulator
MRVQRTRHTRAYVQIPNGIAQNHSLSLEARGLLTYLLSLPDAARATVERIASRTTNGRRVVANAMNELVSAGYVKRGRVQDPETGRWVTLTSVTDNPTNHIPTVGEPTGQAVGDLPKGKDALGNDQPPRASEVAERPVDRADSEGEGEKSSQEKGEEQALTERAAKCLHRLGIHDHRLLLTARETARLAPLAVPWLAAGFHEMEVIRTLTAALPAEIASAAALVTFRLRNHTPEPIEAPKPSEAPSRAVERQTCPECEVIFPRNHPGGICRNCR